MVLFMAVVFLGTLVAGMFIGSRGIVNKAVSTPEAQTDSMSNHHAAPAPADEAVFKALVDKTAPDFGLPSFDGKEIKLSDYKGKKVVLFFSEGAMCQPSCWDQMKAFNEDGYFKKNDVAVLDIVVDDNKTWQGVLSQDPALRNSLVLLDTSKKVSQAYGILTVASSMHKGEFPGHTYIVLDKDGVIRKIFDDPGMRVNNLEIKEALNKIS